MFAQVGPAMAEATRTVEDFVDRDGHGQPAGTAVLSAARDPRDDAAGTQDARTAGHGASGVHPDVARRGLARLSDTWRTGAVGGLGGCPCKKGPSGSWRSEDLDRLDGLNHHG